MNVLRVKVKKLFFFILQQIYRNSIVESKGLNHFQAINTLLNCHSGRLSLPELMSILFSQPSPALRITSTENFQVYQLDLEKADETGVKLPTSIGSQEKQEYSRKTSTSASLTTRKPLIVWITANCGKYLKTWEYQTILPAS